MFSFLRKRRVRFVCKLLILLFFIYGAIKFPTSITYDLHRSWDGEFALGNLINGTAVSTNHEETLGNWNQNSAAELPSLQSRTIGPDPLNTPGMDSALNKNPVPSGLRDWTFSRKVFCPQISLEPEPGIRRKILIDCDNEQEQFQNTTTTVYSLPHKSRCLRAAIRKFCYDNRTVPNVVHYVWLGMREFSFFNLLSFMSVIRFIKPCMILIHGNGIPNGIYWNYFISRYCDIVFVNWTIPTTIGSFKLDNIFHSSDLTRIEVLLEYGGIYLDADEVVLCSIDHLRNYSHSQGYESANALSPALIIAEKNSLFLRLWHDSYLQDYRKDWSYNSMVVPARLARKYPWVLHSVGGKFTDPGLNTNYVYKNNFDWSENYAIHFYRFGIRETVTLERIRTLNTTLGSVSRHVLFGSKELCKT